MDDDQGYCPHDSLSFCLYLVSMPMIAPAKVRISPKAASTLGSMTPVGGTRKEAASSASPNVRKTQHIAV